MTGLASHGSATSNAFLALAALASAHGVPLTYYGRPVPAWMATAGPHGAALRLGATYVPMADYGDVFRDAAGDMTARPVPPAGLEGGAGTAWVPQGGSGPGAEAGVAALAAELEAYASREGLVRPGVVVASGTGCVAAYLHRHAPSLRVFAVPCVGSASFLERQWGGLGAAAPEVLEPTRPAKFAEPSAVALGVWEEVRAAAPGIDFDLAYAPRAWEAVFDAWDDAQKTALPADLIYYHCGGAADVAMESMRARYRRAGLRL